MIATCSADETIFLYNYKKKKTIGSIYSASNTITKLFLTNNFIISASHDGFVYIHGKKDLALYDKLKNNVKIIDMDLKEGVLLLVLTEMNKFSIWNLTDCSMIFIKGLKTSLKLCRFLSDKYIILCSNNSIYFYNLEKNELFDKVDITNDALITNIEILNDTSFCLSFNNGYCNFYNYDFEKEELCIIEVCFFKNKKRIKQTKSLTVNEYNIMTVISSEGDINVYEVSSILKKLRDMESFEILEISPIAYIHITSRLICLETMVINEEKKEEEDGKIMSKKIKKNK